MRLIGPMVGMKRLRGVQIDRIPRHFSVGMLIGLIETIDFDAEEGEWRPAAYGPRTVAS